MGWEKIQQVNQKSRERIPLVCLKIFRNSCKGMKKIHKNCTIPTYLTGMERQEKGKLKTWVRLLRLVLNIELNTYIKCE
jgi:hypothetical protein